MANENEDKERLRYLQLKAKASGRDSASEPVSDSEMPEEPGLLKRIGMDALDAVGQGLNKLDSYTGAPVRSAVSELQNAHGHMLQAIPKAASAYKKQFGEDNSSAPTGKELAQRAGVSDKALSDVLPGMYSETGEGLPLKKGGFLDPTASGTAGMVLNVATDPLTYLPAKKIAEGVKAGAKKLLPGLAKVGEAATGVPARETVTYANKLDEVNQMGRDYGGDVAAAADNTRKKFTSDIAGVRKGANAEISAAKTANPNVTVDVKKVIESLESAKARLNPKFKASDIQEIDGIIDTVRSAADDAGKMSVADAYDLKQYLGDLAAPTYQKGGQIFQTGKDASRAAKTGGFEAKTLVHEAEPGIRTADSTLSKLRNIEKNMNKNLITEGKPEGALLAAGSGNQRARKTLESLGRITGKDMVGEADKLASMRRFASPDILPVDATGKAFARMATGKGIGDKFGRMGSLVGLSSTSPWALKGAVNAGVKGTRALEQVASPAKAAYVGASNLQRSQEPVINKENVLSRVQGSKYEGALQQAADKGDNAFGVTYYFLHQNPEFRQLLNGEDNEPSHETEGVR